MKTPITGPPVMSPTSLLIREERTRVYVAGSDTASRLAGFDKLMFGYGSVQSVRLVRELCLRRLEGRG